MHVVTTTAYFAMATNAGFIIFGAGAIVNSTTVINASV
jgi:hypothetical protein